MRRPPGIKEGTRRRVAVTGLAVYSGFGHGLAPLLSGVFGGEHAFRRIDRFATKACATRLAAIPPRAPSSDGGFAVTPTQVDILEACGLEALQMAGLDPALAPLVVGTNGDHSASRAVWRDTAPTGGFPPTNAFSTGGLVASEVGRRLGTARPRIAHMNACIAASSAIIHGANIIASGVALSSIVGGASLVTEDVFTRFESARAHSPTSRLRPLDIERDGLLQGDGAGILVLEDLETAVQRGATVIAELAGWGMSADAHDVIRPHPAGRGIAESLKRATSEFELALEAIGYINVHGTGTPLNDRAELTGLSNLFRAAGLSTPPLSSTKGSTGHMLEATGVVEAIVCIHALREQLLPPNTGGTRVDFSAPVDVVHRTRNVDDLSLVATVNAAFGGANAALIFADHERSQRTKARRTNARLLP